MTYRGKVRNGVVILEDPEALPEGTDVSVRPLKAKRKPTKADGRGPTVKPGLVKLAGKAKGMPADASQTVEDFLYGRPKR